MGLFDKISAEFRQRLRRKTCAKGDTIIFAEKENDYVHFLIEGSAEAYILNLNGSVTTIYIYESGSFFGEIEQFYHGKKPVTIKAMTHCVLEVMHKDDFLKWMSKDFEVTKYIIKEIAHKLITSAEFIEHISQLTVKERMLRCIAVHHVNGTLNDLTKDLLSKEVNAPIRSINRIIAECTTQEILSFKKKKIVLLNVAAISAYLPRLYL